MATPTIQNRVSEVNAALQAINRQDLPGDARRILQDVQQRLDALAQDLGASQEQARLAALYRVSHALSASLDLDEVLTQVMDSVIGLTKAERGFLVLLEPESREWRLRAARNYSQETLRPKDMEVSRTMLDAVIQTGRGQVTTDASTDPRFSERESVIFYALRSVMCAPLLVSNQVIGAIYVENRAQAGIFSEQDLDLLNAFAAQAAIAIQNARLYMSTDQALARRVSELETLAQVDRELNTRLDLEYVLEITCKWALQIGAAARAWVALVPEETGEAQRFTIYPPGAATGQDETLAQVLADLAPQVARPGADQPARAMLPMLYAGKLLGALAIEREAAFEPPDLAFLGHLAGRAAAAIQNARLYQAVQQANLAKSKFVSVVTHELRIPMTSIKGYTDLLRQGVVGPVNEQQLNFLNVVRNNVERMSALVSDLADISRIETGRLKLECRFFEIGSYVEDTLRSLRPRLDEKNQQLTVDVTADLPRVYADPNRLVQILTNLLSNASKYTPAGGQIRVAARTQDQRVRVDVVDNGIGISPEDQARIFTQFFRSDDPAVREEQGWGLGLNVASRLADIMGGEIGFESALGSGSAFWVALPTEEGNCKS